jgi:hypothetical protein
MFLISLAVSWASRKSPLLCYPLLEPNYMATLNATKEAIWRHTLLEDLGFTQTQATMVHGDNEGCIALSYGTVTHSCAKHINIQHHFI